MMSFHLYLSLYRCFQDFLEFTSKRQATVPLCICILTSSNTFPNGFINTFLPLPEKLFLAWSILDMCCFPTFVYFCGCCVGSNWDGNLLLFGVIEQGKVKAEMLVSQLSKTICDPMDCSPPGSSVHGIFQERVLEWVAIPFPRESSWPRDWTPVSCIAGRFFTIEPPGKPIEQRRRLEKKEEHFMIQFLPEPNYLHLTFKYLKVNL